jgi:7,8-dihydropterin-6-yl-methyl-4-(beta-D-ribofuranosyl)aminobenzene 5'-phosphate synthase
VDVIAHPDMWASKYTHFDSRNEFSGTPFGQESLESLGARFNLSREPVRITEHVMTSGEIPMLPGYETIGDNFLVKQVDALRPDPSRVS